MGLSSSETRWKSQSGHTGVGSFHYCHSVRLGLGSLSQAPGTHAIQEYLQSITSRESTWRLGKWLSAYEWVLLKQENLKVDSRMHIKYQLWGCGHVHACSPSIMVVEVRTPELSGFQPNSEKVKDPGSKE